MCVDFEGFFGDTAAFVGAHGAERAHVVQAVGEFDDDNAHVFGHRQNQFAETFGLMLRLVFEFEFFEFGEAVHHFGDGIAEFRRHFDFGYARVFQYIVQHAPAQALDVHVPHGKLGGDGERVGDVGFAAFTGLSVVGAKREGNCFFKLCLFVFAEVRCSAEQEFAGFGGQRVVRGGGLWGWHFRRPFCFVCVGAAFRMTRAGCAGKCSDDSLNEGGRRSGFSVLRERNRAARAVRLF